MQPVLKMCVFTFLFLARVKGKHNLYKRSTAVCVPLSDLGQLTIFCSLIVDTLHVLAQCFPLVKRHVAQRTRLVPLAIMVLHMELQLGGNGKHKLINTDRRGQFNRSHCLKLVRSNAKYPRKTTHKAVLEFWDSLNSETIQQWCVT